MVQFQNRDAVSLIDLDPVSHLFSALKTSPSYECGSARKFKTSDGHVQDYSMTCLWDKSWEPDYRLPGPCDWVACLKPPLPPASTNLRVTDWDGKPIAFGDIVRYVCQRGYSFEEDPAQLEQTYTCQDGTAPDTNRGFFDVPVEEDEWPRCVRGNNSYEN